MAESPNPPAISAVRRSSPHGAIARRWCRGRGTLSRLRLACRPSLAEVFFMNKLLMVAAVVLTGLGVFATSSCERAPTAGKKVFVMVPKGVHPYYGPCWQGFQDAAKKYGVDVEQKTP